MRLDHGQAGALEIEIIVSDEALDAGSSFLGDNSEASAMYQARGSFLEILKACPSVVAVHERPDRSIAVTLTGRA